MSMTYFAHHIIIMIVFTWSISTSGISIGIKLTRCLQMSMMYFAHHREVGGAGASCESPQRCCKTFQFCCRCLFFSGMAMFKIDLTALEIDLTAFKRVRGVQLETMKPDQFGCSGMFQNEKSSCHCHQHHYHHNHHHHHQGMFINVRKC